MKHKYQQSLQYMCHQPSNESGHWLCGEKADAIQVPKGNALSNRSACCDISVFNLPAVSFRWCLHIILHMVLVQTLNPPISETFHLTATKGKLMKTYEDTHWMSLQSLNRVSIFLQTPSEPLGSLGCKFMQRYKSLSSSERIEKSRDAERVTSVGQMKNSMDEVLSIQIQGILKWCKHQHYDMILRRKEEAVFFNLMLYRRETT